MWTKIRVFLALFTFWIVISERWQWDSLLVGAICSATVIALNSDLFWGKKDLPRFTLRRTWIMIQLIGILLVEVVKANIDVLKIVLGPKIECRQGVVVYCPTLKHKWLRVLLANFITLTPGTMTLDVEGDCFTVHLLDRRSADSVAKWSIAEKLRRLEEE
jgi:multicomponent Na+:H+ antiporter subunit E